MPKLNIYLAGGLFNLADRRRNIALAIALRAADHGREIIIPQLEAERFRISGTDRFVLTAVQEDCLKNCADENNVCVACLDGSDVDSGTAFEFGYAMAKTGRAIGFRTDFRTDEASEVGVNAMFKGKGAAFIYFPCFEAALQGLDDFPLKLAQRIIDKIVAIEKVEGRAS